MAGGGGRPRDVATGRGDARATIFRPRSPRCITAAPPKRAGVDPDTPFAALGALSKASWTSAGERSLRLRCSEADAASAPAQRIDQWLWFARITKSRTLAQALIERGKVRLNRDRIEKPSQSVKAGDVVTISSRSAGADRCKCQGHRQAPRTCNRGRKRSMSN